MVRKMPRIVATRILLNEILICEAPATARSIDFTGLVPDSEYVWHVTNVNDHGYQSPRGEHVFFTKPSPIFDATEEEVRPSHAADRGPTD
jgi:hypothetical protein